MNRKTIVSVLSCLLTFSSPLLMADEDQDRMRDQDQMQDQDKMQDRDRMQDKMHDPDRMYREEPIYGSQLMTEKERMEYRNRMRTAKTKEERERIRNEHHEQMMARAKEQGVTLPDPPAEMRHRRDDMPPGGGMRMEPRDDMGKGGGRR